MILPYQPLRRGCSANRSSATYERFGFGKPSSAARIELADLKGGSAHNRILRAVQTGIVLTVLGAALFGFVAAVSLPYPVPENLRFLATVTTAIGAGLLISSFVSYRLSRKLGLIDEHGRRSVTTTA